MGDLPSLGSVVWQGWLSKKGSFMPTIKRRYGTLSIGKDFRISLDYRESESSPTSKGVYTFNSETKFLESAPLGSFQAQQCLVIVIDESAKIHCGFDTTEERSKFQTAVERAISARRLSAVAGRSSAPADPRKESAAASGGAGRSSAPVDPRKAISDASAAASAASEYPEVRQAIEKYISDNEDMGPTLVRLAWHASGTYDVGSKTGGSNGASMRFSPECAWDANKGLGCARDALEQIKQQHPGITYADLWTLAGAVAIEYMGGPKIPWRSGRTDAVDSQACPPDGRLPAADKGCPAQTVQHIRDIFYRQGFNDQEIVALIGAHTLGRCHTEASGYLGPWVRMPTTFSNMYFKELLGNTWTLKKWSGPVQYEDPTGTLMMLPSDMAIVFDKTFREWAVKYRNDEQLFFQHFASAWTKLTENGVKF